MKCWICTKELTQNNAVGVGKSTNICKVCNRIYTQIARLRRLADEDLLEKIRAQKENLALCRFVRENKRDSSAGDLTKKYREKTKRRK